jgi:hypothetical protein
MRALIEHGASLLDADRDENALPPGMLDGVLEAFRWRRPPVS